MSDKTTKQMLQELIAEIDMADPAMYSPIQFDEKNDKVIGKVEDDYLRRIQILILHYAKQAMTYKLDASFEANKEERDRLSKESAVCGHKSKAYYGLFWFLTRNFYNVFDKPILGVRDNWELVETKGHEPFDKQIRGLLGEAFDEE